MKDASVITANRKTEFIDNKQSWYVITVLINTFHCKLQLTYFWIPLKIFCVVIFATSLRITPFS